jgi:chromosome segregation ATPase
MAQTAIESATRRLSQALDVLEAAVDRRLEAARNAAGLAEQLHALGGDRARLAAELDAETARARRLEATNHDIARRLDAAMDTIRSVIDGPKS